MNTHDLTTSVLDYATANGRNDFRYLTEVFELSDSAIVAEMTEHWTAEEDADDLERAVERARAIVDLAVEIRAASDGHYRGDFGHTRYACDIIVWDSEEDSENDDGQKALHRWPNADRRVLSMLD